MRLVALLVGCCLVSSPLLAQDDKKADWHCEKKDKDGNMADFPSATSKKDCKKAKGKWTKVHTESTTAQATPAAATPAAAPAAAQGADHDHNKEGHKH